MGAVMVMNMRDLRKQRGWTQEDLARAANLTTGTISRVERGEDIPNLPTAQAIARALGVGVDDIEWPKKGAEGASSSGE